MTFDFTFDRLLAAGELDPDDEHFAERFFGLLANNELLDAQRFPAVCGPVSDD